MHDSKRYRDRAAECLSSADEGRNTYYREFNRHLAASWLALASQDKAMDDLLASWTPDGPATSPTRV